MERFILINNERNRIKVFEPFEDVSKPSPSIDAMMISYGCVYKRSSKPVMKGSRVETIEEARKEYKKLMEEERKKLEKMYQELNEEDSNIKKWNQALIPKAILLFPPIAFALTFLKINTDKSLIDLLGFVAMGLSLIHI